MLSGTGRAPDKLKAKFKDQSPGGCPCHVFFSVTKELKHKARTAVLLLISIHSTSVNFNVIKTSKRLVHAR